MSDGPDAPGERPDDAPRLRVGHAERDEAMRALDAHLEAGRLDVTEYGDRCGAAAAAVHRDELDALFVDLPAPHPAATVPAAPEPAGAPSSGPPHHPARRGPHLGALVPVLLAIGMVLLVTVFHNPGGFALFPLVFLVAGRFGRRRS